LCKNPAWRREIELHTEYTHYLPIPKQKLWKNFLKIIVNRIISFLVKKEIVGKDG
jgi:hypothetical protein